ncbi:MAG TPA: hypothetical protein VGG75_12500 [Trebonia sp.]
MDDESVLQLIKGDESEQVERKEQFKNKKTEVCRAICAFANDFPRTGKPRSCRGLSPRTCCRRTTDPSTSRWPRSAW